MVIELENGCWLCTISWIKKWYTRTTVKKYAYEFQDLELAEKALEIARTDRPFKNARIVDARIKEHKFEKNQQVTHVKTGNLYVILNTPNPNDRLSSGEMFYKYQRVDSNYPVKWRRSISEMEDGRFI